MTKTGTFSNTGIEVKAGKYYGAFDDYGLEGILPFNDSSKIQLKATEYSVACSKIRSQANSHRNAFTFVCVLTKKEALAIFEQVDKAHWKKAARLVKAVWKKEIL